MQKRCIELLSVKELCEIHEYLNEASEFENSPHEIENALIEIENRHNQILNTPSEIANDHHHHHITATKKDCLKRDNPFYALFDFFLFARLEPFFDVPYFCC